MLEMLLRLDARIGWIVFNAEDPSKNTPHVTNIKVRTLQGLQILNKVQEWTFGSKKESIRSCEGGGNPEILEEIDPRLHISITHVQVTVIFAIMLRRG